MESLATQTLIPGEVLVVDASDWSGTADLCEELRESLPFPLRYHRARVRSSAVQRNEGAMASVGELILFLDDDVVLEPEYVREITAVFENDTKGQVGGVSGTIVNQKYAAPSYFNRLLLLACLGQVPGPGTLVGPAVNMLPSDSGGATQIVQWLNSTGVVYRRDVFLSNLFPEFAGYSFMEDVHLSARVARSHLVMNATRARLLHEDLGNSTHANWVEHGRAMLVNRRTVMVEVLGRTGLGAHMRLAMYELVYCTLASLRAAREPRALSRAAMMLWGRVAGLVQLFRPAASRASGEVPISRAGRSLF